MPYESVVSAIFSGNLSQVTCRLYSRSAGEMLCDKDSPFKYLACPVRLRFDEIAGHPKHPDFFIRAKIYLARNSLFRKHV